MRPYCIYTVGPLLCLILCKLWIKFVNNLRVYIFILYLYFTFKL